MTFLRAGRPKVLHTGKAGSWPGCGTMASLCRDRAHRAIVVRQDRLIVRRFSLRPPKDRIPGTLDRHVQLLRELSDRPSIEKPLIIFPKTIGRDHKELAIKLIP